MSDFAKRYGPWAVIAGASVGLGEAFARRLAERGINLVLVARRQEALDSLATQLRATYTIDVRTLAADLARPDLPACLQAVTSDLDVGLVVYNAAYSTIGAFLDRPLDEHLKVVDVNCRGPLVLAHHFGRGMAARARGGIVLMS